MQASDNTEVIRRLDDAGSGSQRVPLIPTPAPILVADFGGSFFLGDSYFFTYFRSETLDDVEFLKFYCCIKCTCS